MEKENNVKEYYTIDLLQIAKALWQRAWMIVLSAVLAGAVGFSIAAFFTAPKYSSSVMLYVNNKSFSLGGTSVSFSASDISASRSLVKTYTEILNSRQTLEKVVEASGVSYSPQALAGMISAGPANDTEIMKVTVVSTDAEEAALIANSIAEVLPDRIEEIIDGATMKVVNTAIPNYNKVSPSITKYTAVGIFLGILASVGVIAIATIMDDTIYDEDYVLQTYKYPVLARIPDLLESGSKHYGYYYQTGKKQQKPEERQEK